ncbi:hexosaminidase D [Chanos chanos]|uniref:beta-N-acetylhexosaminidase n=1 Tax=Chanos chanos TaxID=29144 RepID=A0A6J2VBU5_CHACN|nr:hexosaminidase D-like [Chanos chanos]
MTAVAYNVRRASYTCSEYKYRTCTLVMDGTPLTTGKKFVHLDLKGAPPRIDYLRKLIELFADLGANGLLVEYEDMFPYEGELEILRAEAHPPYSREEIVSIQDVAKARELEIVPLVQTFGHLEFVLKHEAFRDLRETPHCIGTLNPHKERGVKMVQEMVRQVMELHPNSTSLHIGADEVYLLGQGEESRQWLSERSHSVDQLFLGHVVKVARGIRESFPVLGLIMWDDMLRGMSSDTIKESGLVGLVQPMVWNYSPALDVASTVALMEKYSTAGLCQQWVASSFKGSTTVHSCVTPTLRHVENHLQWLKVASALSETIALQGIALTGWQRYDHLSVLCELIPLGLASLASCLQTLEHGSFSEAAQCKVTDVLGIPSVEIEDIQRPSPGSSSLFPGGRLAELVVELVSLLNCEDLRHCQTNMFVRGWFSPYHRERSIINPLIAQQIQTELTMVLNVLELKVQEVKDEMRLLYPDSTAEEWVEEHVHPVLTPLRTTLHDIRLALENMGHL